MESEAWNEGHDAFEDGIHAEENPYSVGIEHEEWEEGWYAAQEAFTLYDEADEDE